MATVTKTIGTGQDYATITLWEASLDATDIYSSGDSARGVLNVDEALDETVTIDGGGTVGLSDVLLTAATDVRHNGTAGTGARIVRSGTGAVLSLKPHAAGTDILIVEWLEINANDTNTNIGISAEGATAGRVPVVRYCIIHDAYTSSTNAAGIRAGTRDCRVQNCIVYNWVTKTSSRDVRGLWLDSDKADGGCLNNTVYNVKAEGSGSFARGINIVSDNANGKVRNNISMGTVGTDPTNPDFQFGGSSNLTSSNNMSEDDTADDGGGSDHIINVTPSDQFVSIVDGAENLHLIFTSSAVNAGADLGTYQDRNLDIDGDNRGTKTGLSFDGLNDFINFGDINLLDSATAVTYLFRANINSTQPEASVAAILTKYSNSGDNRSVFIDIRTATGKLRHSLYNASSGNRAVQETDSAVPTDTDTTFAVRWTGSPQNTDLFVDGSEVASTASNAGIPPTSFPNVNALLFVGANDAPRDYYCKLVIDEIAIYTKALSDNDINDYHNSGNGLYLDPTGTWATDGGAISDALAVLWHLDEKAGTETADDSGNDADGDITGATWATGLVDNYVCGAWDIGADECVMCDVTVSSVTPTSGSQSGGTAVTILGSGFAAGAVVQFDDSNATSVVVVSDTTITCDTPAEDPATVDVKVINLDNQSDVLASAFTFTQDLTVSDVTPNTGTVLGGTSVTIGGIGFLAGATVTFGGVAATSVVIVSSSEITCETPAGSAGAVDVVVTLTDLTSATLSDAYTYTEDTITGKATQYLDPGFEGVKMLGANGATATDNTGWFRTPPGNTVMSFQWIPQSAQAADIEVVIQGALDVAEARSNPFTIKQWDGSDGNDKHTEENVAYDFIRVLVTGYKAAGNGSQILVSGRKKDD